VTRVSSSGVGSNLFGGIFLGGGGIYGGKLTKVQDGDLRKMADNKNKKIIQISTRLGLIELFFVLLHFIEILSQL